MRTELVHYTPEDCAADYNHFRSKTGYGILGMGLALLKAHSLFASPGGRPRNSDTVSEKTADTVSAVSESPSGSADTVSGDSESPSGFVAWLAENTDLNERTARRYITAARNAGLTESDDRESIARLESEGFLEGRTVTSLYGKTQYQKTIEAPAEQKALPREEPVQLVLELEQDIRSWFGVGSRRRNILLEAPLPQLKQVEDELRHALDVVREARQVREQSIRGGNAA